MDCLGSLEVLLVGDDRAKVAAKQSDLAQALYDLGLHEYASMTSGFALGLVQEMFAAAPDDFRLPVASLQLLRANILVDLKENEQAVRAADEAVALYKEHERLRGVSVPELAHARLNQAVLLCSIALKEDGAGVAFELLCEADESWQDKEYISALCQLCLSNACIETDSDLALSAVEEAIDHCRTQVDLNFRAVLASALLTKSKILSTKGQNGRAYALSSEAVVLLRGISVQRPVFSLILAHALDTYSHHLSDVNLNAVSYAIAQEAVELWRAMRPSAPSAITRPLAWALSHLAKFRRQDGDQDALRNELLASESAVGMFREVSPPDAAGLADALYLAADRSFELDKKHEAAFYAEESVQYFREAASQAPDKYALDLIFSLSLASSCLASVARTDDALEYAKQAVEVQRERMGMVEYDIELRKLLTDVVLRFEEADRQWEALPWFQELQALGETRGTGEVPLSDQQVGCLSMESQVN